MNNIDALVIEVKEKIKITWSDPDTDKRVKSIVLAALKICDFKIGAHEDEIDYEEEGQEKLLFLNFCMYEWYDRAEEFDSNYQNELLQLRMKYQVKHKEEEEAVEEDK